MSSTTLPVPIVVPASGLFEGFDGNWSTFNISLGSNNQPVRLIPSTTVTEFVIVDSGVCDDFSPSNCSSIRGGTFNISESTSWTPNQNLTVSNGVGSNGYLSQFGFDTVSVPGVNQKPVPIDNQLMTSGNTTTNSLELGFIPLSPDDTDLPGQAAIPSYLSGLKSANLIPGTGYGFTAGASYHDNTPGSLVLGGYDASRFTTNDLIFSFGPDRPGQLQVGVQQITSVNNGSDSTEQSLLVSGGILANIDSTVPDMWLPLDSCTAFAKAFGLSYTPNNLRYSISDEDRQTNLHNNPNITFTIGNAADSGATIPIVMPYAAFDLMLEPPLVTNASRYFPLRQALQPNQYTLGRVFLQEAYVLFNFEKGNFNLYQALYPPGNQHIISIASQNGTGSTGTEPTTSSTAAASPSNTALTITHSSSKISGGAIGGIVIAIIATLAIIGGVLLWRKKQQKRKEHDRMLAAHVELSGAEHKGYYGGALDNGSDQQSTRGHSQKPSFAVSEADSNVVGQRHSRNGGGLHPPLVELDEGAPRGEMESVAATSPPRSPRLGNVPTYIEMPSPTFSGQSTMASPTAEDARSASQALSTQDYHSTRQSPLPSPPDENSQAGSPLTHPASAFVSPQLEAAPSRFGHPSPEGQLEPFSLSHSPAQSPIELQSSGSLSGPGQGHVPRHQNQG